MCIVELTSPCAVSYVSLSDPLRISSQLCTRFVVSLLALQALWLFAHPSLETGRCERALHAASE